MRTRKDYLNTFREISENLGIKGQMSEILSQMLAEATYISEVEQVSIAKEGSLENCVLTNSKIQHCMDQMYSVYRGLCPRVILNFKCYKLLTLNPYDLIYSSNKFSVYYLGYCTDDTRGIKEIDTKILNYKSKSEDDLFVYSGATFPPTNDLVDYTIIALITPNLYSRSISFENNKIYFDLPFENLSNDIFIKRDENSFYPVSRNFDDHVSEENTFFDLTLPDFGSRLYFPIKIQDIGDSITEFKINVVEYCSLSEFNTSELRSIKFPGTVLSSFGGEWHGYNEDRDGLIFIEETGRDQNSQVHYKAIKNRYSRGMIKSNSDVCYLLEEYFPEKVYPGGTNYRWNEGKLELYYVPVKSNHITSVEKENFIKDRKSYYITEDINIYPGIKYYAEFKINAEIYSEEDVYEEINKILSSYGNKFNTPLGGENIRLGNKDGSVRNEIISLINKISNIRRVTDLQIIFKNSNRSIIDYNNIELDISYFEISLNLITSIYSL